MKIYAKSLWPFLNNKKEIARKQCVKTDFEFFAPNLH